MNDKELKHKVNAAMYALMKDKGVTSSAEVLIAHRCFEQGKLRAVAFGKVDYLERVCQINLGKLSTVNRKIRAFAKKNDLKPSWIDYHKWGKGQSTRLRFSKSGDENIERSYATHYVSQQKADEAKERRASNKAKNETIGS